VGRYGVGLEFLSPDRIATSLENGRNSTPAPKKTQADLVFGTMPGFSCSERRSLGSDPPEKPLFFS